MPRKLRTADSILQLKVSLKGGRPPIWRRLLVPASMTLGQLHDTIQSVMEWQDSHLHEFQIGELRYGPADMDIEGLEPEGEDESRVRLDRVLGRVGARAVYTYDFGDNWEHAIVVEKVLPPEPGQSYPLCVAGKRQGPPEDCGGAWSYANLIAALRDPNHEEHEEMVEMYGDDLASDEFSVEDMNDRLARLRKE